MAKPRIFSEVWILWFTGMMGTHLFVMATFACSIWDPERLPWQASIVLSLWLRVPYWLFLHFLIQQCWGAASRIILFLEAASNSRVLVDQTVIAHGGRQVSIIKRLCLREAIAVVFVAFLVALHDGSYDSYYARG
jgi:hypothetical protein